MAETLPPDLPSSPAREADLGDDLPEKEPAASGGRERFFRLFPALGALRTYNRHAFRSDLVAGLTVAAVAVPQAMAYALVAGLPPEYGLYTAIIMTGVGAIFDSSRQLINGPTNAISIAILSALAFIPLENVQERVGAAVFLALCIGLIQTTITLFRLGDMTRYVSHSVIVGFTAGAGLLLVLDQIKNLFGLPAVPDGAHDLFVLRFWASLEQIGSANLWATALGFGSIGLVLGFRGLKTRMRLALFPDLLLTVIVAAFLVWLLDLEQHGVGVVGKIPAKGLRFDLPTIRLEQFRQLTSSALAIAVLGLLEAIAMAKAIAAQTGQKLDVNQQCLSEGLANLAGSCFQCMPGSGSLTRSAINQQAGAVTQWSGVFSALAVLGTMLVLGPFARFIPKAALAGILIVSAWRMVDRKQLVYHFRATRFDAGIVLATALSAIFISVEFCILVGVLLSFVLFVRRAARLHIAELTVTPERVIRERLAADPPCGKILIYALEGELFFGSAHDLENHLELIENRARPGIRVVVLRMKRIRNPDAVCLQLLDGFVKRLNERKVTVLLCGVRRDLGKILRKTGVAERLGPDKIFIEAAGLESSTLNAIRHAYDLLGSDICSVCPRQAEQPTEPLYYMI